MKSDPSFYGQLHSIRRMAALLPFGLNDTQSVNMVYKRWREHETPMDRRHLDIWTYCYVRRYYIQKLISRPGQNITHLDLLMEKCLVKIHRSNATITSPDRYAQWVSVVSKNTFLNQVRSRYSFVDVDEVIGTVVHEPAGFEVEANNSIQAVSKAIDSLPPFLREVARLRILDDWTYGEISDKTGQPLPIVRSYTHKAVKRLRAHPVVAELKVPTRGL